MAPRVQRTFGVATHIRQALAHRSGVVPDDRDELGRRWLWPLIAVALVVASGTQIEHMGVPLVATTERRSRFVGPLDQSQELMSLIVPLLIVFFAGELVWREREARVSEITDAAPVPEWVSAARQVRGTEPGARRGAGADDGGRAAHPGAPGPLRFRARPVRARLFSDFSCPDYLLFALLALVVHVLVNHKYVGHLVVVIAYVFMAFGSALGVEHNLLVYGSDPGWSYSDMRGFEPFIGPWLWFKLYWAAWALLLAVAATLFWVRGKEADVGSRLGLARRRLTRRAVAALPRRRWRSS